VLSFLFYVNDIICLNSNLTSGDLFGLTFEDAIVINFDGVAKSLICLNFKSFS